MLPSSTTNSVADRGKAWQNSSSDCSKSDEYEYTLDDDRSSIDTSTHSMLVLWWDDESDDGIKSTSIA
ncbi:MAG: hypothetical protein CV090_16445 [Nitrospira sp. WS238]|nr:hypothetical protein [Nitrospira sp. WS238]